MPANLREPVSLLTGTKRPVLKICIPPSKISFLKMWAQRSGAGQGQTILRVAVFAMNGRSPEENSLELSLCRLLAWARSPPRQQEDKAFVTSFDVIWGL